jgi:hypothetical protein
MRSHNRIFLLPLIALSALLVSTAAIKAAAPYDHAVFFGRFPLSGEFDLVNPCNGEEVVGTLEGQGHLLIVADGGGGAHLQLMEEVHGHGETIDGTLYAVGQPLTSVTAATFESDRRIVILATTVHFISAGASDNFVAHAVQHLTVTPDGTVTSEFTFVSNDCRG